MGHGKGGAVFNLGGLLSSFTQIELEYPLAKEAGLKWVVFFDAGDAVSSLDEDDFKIHADYGFGFRWFSPIIGVLRFEFGYPLRKLEGRRGGGSRFHFDIGQLF